MDQNNAKKYSGKPKSTLRSALFALGIGLSTPVIVHALSLGDISTQSYLNQPLQFQVPINIAKSEGINADNVVVSIASSDEYARQGLVYPWGLGNIGLQVVRHKNGKLFVHGKSEKSVRDLIVFLLLKIEWPGGVILKEYSALIDLKDANNAPVLVERSAATRQSKTAKPAAANTANNQGGVHFGQAQSNSAATSGSRASAPRHFAGFGSDQDYRDYKIKAGDSLSVIAQQLRGDVKLPLHHYIGAITEANQSSFRNGLGNLEVGQVIKIPNPSLVAATYSQKRRRLEDSADGNSHQYRVKYGDSLFLIAKAFHPEGVSEVDYIHTLREHNPQLGNGSFLEPGIVLTIPSPNQNAPTTQAEPTAADAELAASENTQPFVAEAIGSDEAIGLTPVPMPNEAEDSDMLNSLNQVAPVIEQLPEHPLDESATEELNNTDSVDGNRPMLDANEQLIESGAVDTQLADAQLLAENSQMQQQIDELQGQITGLKDHVSSLTQENNSLNGDIINFKEQQQASKKSNNFVLIGLAVLAAVLAALCLLFYSKMRQLARRIAGLGSKPVAAAGIQHTEAKTGLLAGVFGSKAAETQPSNNGEKDYSNYDFSKSNYDYSQLYDIEKLKEDIKSTGSSAFVQTGGTIELDDSEEDLDTVREFVSSKHYEVADKLLAKMRDDDPDNFEYQLTWLDLQMRRGNENEAKAVEEALREQFPDQIEEIDSTVTTTQAWLDEQQDEAEPAGILERATADVLDEQEQQQDSAEPAKELDENTDTFDVAEQDERLYEVRVYMSYGHDEMAHNSLEEYLQDNPSNLEALFLKLELYLRGKNPASAILLAEQIKQNHDLDDAQLNEIDGLVAAAKRSMSQDEQEQNEIKSEDLMLDEFDALLEQDNLDTELTEFIDDNEKTQLMGDIEDVVMTGSDDSVSLEATESLLSDFTLDEPNQADDTQTIMDELDSIGNFDDLDEPLDSDKLK